MRALGKWNGINDSESRVEAKHLACVPASQLPGRSSPAATCTVVAPQESWRATPTDSLEWLMFKGNLNSPGWTQEARLSVEKCTLKRCRWGPLPSKAILGSGVGVGGWASEAGKPQHSGAVCLATFQQSSHGGAGTSWHFNFYKNDAPPHEDPVFADQSTVGLRKQDAAAGWKLLLLGPPTSAQLY